MNLLLWILAAVLIVVGVLTLLQGSILFGIILIVVGLILTPEGVGRLRR